MTKSVEKSGFVGGRYALSPAGGDRGERVKRLAAESRARCGLPPGVEDEATLVRITALLWPATEARTGRASRKRRRAGGGG